MAAKRGAAAKPRLLSLASSSYSRMRFTPTPLRHHPAPSCACAALRRSCYSGSAPAPAARWGRMGARRAYAGGVALWLLGRCPPSAEGRREAA